MLYSMTGYGKAEIVLSESRHLLVEIKSLNGKNFDLNNRFPPLFRPYEALIRKLLQQVLHRGSVDITLSLKQNGATRPIAVNKELAKYYYQSMQELSADLSLNAPDEQLLQTLMSLPEVIVPEAEDLKDSDWETMEKCIEKAAESLTQYRLTEGNAIEKDLLQRVANIQQLLAETAPLEKERINRIRTRIQATLAEWQVKTDENRFEQELIYYIEKIDFSEEKQRLAAHCTYFEHLVAQAEEDGIGKKLGFVLQEMGREINTLGSKANDADIQKIVINMKDELEKAKEQVLNVL